MSMTCFVVCTFSVGMMVLGAGGVSGQIYPNKPIAIITGGIGGGNDFAARLIAPALSVSLGQPVIVDNRGSGVLPAEAASKAPPDGHTLLLHGTPIWITPLLQKTPYDPVGDFSPITSVASQPHVLVVHPSLPVKSVKELIALAKARPGALAYGAGTAGASTYFSSALFRSMAGIDIVYVPYAGTPPAVTALISGEVQMVINDVGLLMPHAKSGKLRALGVTSATPSAVAPGLPTVAASGLPGYEWVGMTGVWAPAKTPAPIITRLNQEIVQVLNRSEMKEKFLNAGTEAVGSSPEGFAALIKADVARTSKVIKDAGIRAN